MLTLWVVWKGVWNLLIGGTFLKILEGHNRLKMLIIFQVSTLMTHTHTQKECHTDIKVNYLYSNYGIVFKCNKYLRAKIDIYNNLMDSRIQSDCNPCGSFGCSFYKY